MELMVRRRWVVHQKEIILVTVLRLVNPCSGQSYNFRPERVYLPISVVDYTIFSFFFLLNKYCFAVVHGTNEQYR